MPEKKVTKINKKGHEEEWSWDETSEMTAAVERLHETIRQLERENPGYGVGK